MGNDKYQVDDLGGVIGLTGFARAIVNSSEISESPNNGSVLLRMSIGSGALIEPMYKDVIALHLSRYYSKDVKVSMFYSDGKEVDGIECGLLDAVCSETTIGLFSLRRLSSKTYG